MVKNIINQPFLYLPIFFLIILEVFCAKLAFETLGEIDSSIYYFVVALNLIPLALLMLNKQKQLAIGLILLIGLLIIPYQLYLGHKLIYLKEEAANITAYLYEEKVSKNAYPADLSGYTFSYPKLQKHFTYTRWDGKGSHQYPGGYFHLQYYVGTKSTSHYYYSYIKTWHYYPD